MVSPPGQDVGQQRVADVEGLLGEVHLMPPGDGDGAFNDGHGYQDWPVGRNPAKKNSVSRGGHRGLAGRPQPVVPRGMLHRILLLMSLLFPGCVSALRADTARLTGARPNILLVMTDDQGYGEIGAHGNPILRTPHLDALHS